MGMKRVLRHLYKIKIENAVEETAFWDIEPCGIVEVQRRFRGAYCLHYQDGNRGSTHL
jgi:hypothetical protein